MKLSQLFLKASELRDRVHAIPLESAAFDLPEAELLTRQIVAYAHSLERVLPFLSNEVAALMAGSCARTLIAALEQRVAALEALHRRGLLQ